MLTSVCAFGSECHEVRVLALNRDHTQVARGATVS